MKDAPPRRPQGFTLIEMLIVLAIISLLVGMGTYMMKNVLGDADEGRVKADIQALNASLIRYKTRAGIYPTTEQGLQSLVSMPTVGPKPRSYKSLMKPAGIIDPWGNPYEYKRPGDRNPETYDIYSRGLDGEKGTADDIGNW